MLKRLDGGYGWAIVAAQFIIGVCVYGTAKTSGVMFVYFKEEYNSSYSATASISLTQRVTETSSALIFSFLAERYGSRPVMLVGACFLVIGSLSSAFVTTISELAGTYGALVGLGSAMLAYPGGQMIPKYFDKKIAIASAISFTGGSFGPLILPIIVQSAVGEYGLSGSFFILAAVYLHVFISATLMRPPHHFRKPSRGSENCDVELKLKNGACEKTLLPADDGQVEVQLDKMNVDANVANVSIKDKSKPDIPSVKEMMKKYKLVLSNKSLLLYFLLYICTAVAALNFLSYQQAHIIDRGITDRTRQSLLTVLWGVSEIISRISFGFLLQTGIISPYRVHQSAALLMTVAFCVYPSLNAYWAIACCSIVVAFLWSSIIASIVPSLRHIIGIELCSTAFGVVCIPVMISFASVQLGSLCRDLLGTFIFVYYACAIILVVGVGTAEIIAWRMGESIFQKIPAFCTQRRSNSVVKDDL